MKKAALYIRVSTNHQIDKDSLPFQENELINYATYALGIDQYEVFADAGYSGKDTDRPKYQEMMKRIREREFTHLVVWKIDRISRNLIDFASMYDEIKQYDCVFVSRNEQFDTSSAMGEAMLKIILIFAELERKLTAERVYSIMLSRAEKGKWNGANCPMGYVWSDEAQFPVPYPEESEIIKFIFNEYLKLNSAVNVANILAENNIKTKRGGHWGSKGIVDIIRNPFYKGTYRYNYRESARGKKKKESEWIVIDDNHEGIVDKDLWEKCNEIMDKNAQRNSAAYRKNSHVHIFSGLLECSDCHSIFIANLDRPRSDGYTPSRYRCKSKSIGSGCDASMISEITLGPFIINYIANILKAYKSIESLKASQDLESILLTGDPFKKVKHISRGLKELHKLFTADHDKSIIFALSEPVEKVVNLDKERLDRELAKYKRALERLDDLYLFDDNAMAEKDYLIKKNKLQSSLTEVQSKLKLIMPSYGHVENDTAFLIKSANFLLSTKLLEHDFIVYKDLDVSTDKQLIKNFVISIIEKIIIENGAVKAIYFKNGMVHEFEWK